MSKSKISKSESIPEFEESIKNMSEQDKNRVDSSMYKMEKLHREAVDYCNENHKGSDITYAKCYDSFIAGATSPAAEQYWNGWVSVEDRLPESLETVWISNGRGWTTLGCRSDLYEDTNEDTGELEWHWCWCASNGIIWEEDGKIVSECENDDLNVKFWKLLPSPPKTDK